MHFREVNSNQGFIGNKAILGYASRLKIIFPHKKIRDKTLSFNADLE